MTATRPGQKAADKAIDILSAGGVKLKVLSYTGAKDPDEFLKTKGVESFKQVIAKALSATEYRILKARKNYNLVESDQTVEFLEKAAEILAAKSQRGGARNLHETNFSRNRYFRRINFGPGE